MKVHKVPVTSISDITKSGKFQVKIPGLLDDPWVTYVSPTNNLDKGIFAPPTPNSEVLVLELPVEGEEGNQSGYYYLGSIVGNINVAGMVSKEKLSEDYIENPESAEGVSLEEGEIKYNTSFGIDAPHPPTLPIPFQDAYSNEVTPDKMGMSDTANNALILMDQKRNDGGDSWINVRTRLQSGAGKRVDLVDTPAQDFIKITTGKADGVGEDYVMLGGKQNGIGATVNSIQSGEFKVDTHGPSNIVSRDKGIELRAQGLNINIINDADGLFAPDADGRYIIFPGGQDPFWPLEADDELLGDLAGPGLSPAELEKFRRKMGGYPPLPKPSIVSSPTGNAHPFHPTGGPPGAKPDGGNPLDKGNEKYGNVNIRSEWNNINIEGRGVDSVIHLNAPHFAGKIVITTGGTVDIIATQKVSITSGESIELNAPYIDINSGIRTDID
jgi:hypothetical protein